MDVDDAAASTITIVPLSDEAALRRMLTLTPSGQAMLFAMMRFVLETQTHETVMRVAATRSGLREGEARRGIIELIDRSLLRRNASGKLVLHGVFAATAHHWRGMLSKTAHDGCKVVMLTPGGGWTCLLQTMTILWHRKKMLEL